MTPESSVEPKSHLTLEQKTIESRKEGLELSRSRVLEQIRSAENPRYRQILEESLADARPAAHRLAEPEFLVSWVPT